MELRKLLEPEMGQISGPWVTEANPVRSAIEARSMLAALLPQLTAAHAAIVALGAQSSDPDIRKLSAEANRLDAQHDDYIRTIYDALTVLAKTSKAGDQLLRMRDSLFPEGRRHINRSHSAEAGHAAALASTVGADALARMKAVAVGDMTLFDLYSQYQETAKQLGAVDEKRARLNQPAVTPAAQVQAVRRQWIRWANILVDTAANADLDAETDALLFGPLREMVERANSRWHTKIAPAAAPVPTPVKNAT